jgi:hypothetical protein
MPGLVKLSLAIVSALMVVHPVNAQVSVVVPIPEPATWTIFAVGLVGVALAVRRNRRK